MPQKPSERIAEIHDRIVREIPDPNMHPSNVLAVITYLDEMWERGMSAEENHA